MNINDIALALAADLDAADLADNADDSDFADALIDDAPETDYYDDALIDAVESADRDELHAALTKIIASMR